MSLPQQLRKTALATVALLSLLLAGAVAAQATNYHDAIRDCFDDGVLQGHYSRHVLQQALNHLPSDEAEYSDCADVLRRALIASGTRGGTGGGSSGPTLPSNSSLTTPSGAQAGSQQAFNDLKNRTSGRGGAPNVSVGGHEVKPGTGGILAAAHTGPNKLPSSLLASLIALAALCALSGLLVIHRRWPETRRVARRLLRR